MCIRDSSKVCRGVYLTHAGHVFWFAEPQLTPPAQGCPSLYSVAQTLVGSTRGSTKSRNEIRAKNGHPMLSAPSITERDILEMMLEQKMRCAYLDVPIFTEAGDWHMSLERKDETDTYTRENCVLIAGEVNTAHFQWSRAFADRVWPRTE